MHSRSLEVLVGFFICLGVAAIFVMTFRVASLDTVSEHGSYWVTAKFDNIGSLVTGSSVKLAGVRIGRVLNITIDPKSFEAVATLEIASEYNYIPVDSAAKIQTAGLLGEQYISLEPGGSDQNLKNDDRIQMTQSAFVLENLIGQMLVSTTSKGDKSDKGAEPAPATGKPK
jgi:phospholipid/cholesterol/gamma-HCH transport system substrate-binding protein